MKYTILKKANLSDWLSHLKSKAKLYGPKRKENLFVFGPLKDAQDLCLDYIPTIIPVKKYYYPQKEKLFKFSSQPFKTTPTEKFEDVVLFALHTCDIAGVQCMDVVFGDSPEDPNYLNRKERTIVIGIECLKPCDKYANCTSMGNHVPHGGYDLMIVDIGDKFIIHINSEKGEKLTTGYMKEATDQDMEQLERVREAKKKVFKEEFIGPLTKVYEAFEKYFSSAVWKDVGRRCIACGNCTQVCPTCYCFDTKDEVELSLNEGTRSRFWNSCQMEDFAKVAGGEDFRKGRDGRQRHRYYRKFKYPVDRYNRYFCIGCGRCTRTCMAGISLIETVNSLISEEGLQ